MEEEEKGKIGWRSRSDMLEMVVEGFLSELLWQVRFDGKQSIFDIKCQTRNMHIICDGVDSQVSIY